MILTILSNCFGIMSIEAWSWTVGEKILRRNQLIKVAVNQASFKEKKNQVDKMKAMCFLLNSDQNRYSFLLKQLGDGYNMGRDNYPVTTTSELDILICTEGGIWGNQ